MYCNYNKSWYLRLMIVIREISQNWFNLANLYLNEVENTLPWVMQSILATQLPPTRNFDSLSGTLLSLISAVSGSIDTQLSGSKILAYLKEIVLQLSNIGYIFIIYMLCFVIFCIVFHFLVLSFQIAQSICLQYIALAIICQLGYIVFNIHTHRHNSFCVIIHSMCIPLDIGLCIPG